MEGSPNFASQLANQLSLALLLQKQNETNQLQNQFFHQSQPMFSVNTGQPYQNGATLEDLERLKLMQALQNQQKISQMLSNSQPKLPSLMNILLGQVSSMSPHASSPIGGSPILSNPNMYNSLIQMALSNNPNRVPNGMVSNGGSPSTGVIGVLERLVDELKSTQFGEKARANSCTPAFSAGEISNLSPSANNFQGDLEKMLIMLTANQANQNGQMSNLIPAQTSMDPLEEIINLINPKLNSTPNGMNLSNSLPLLSIPPKNQFSTAPRNFESETCSSPASTKSNPTPIISNYSVNEKASKSGNPEINMLHDFNRFQVKYSNQIAESKISMDSESESESRLHQDEKKLNQWGNLLDNTLQSFGSIDLRETFSMPPSSNLLKEVENLSQQENFEKSSTFSVSEFDSNDLQLDNLNLISLPSLDPSIWETEGMVPETFPPIHCMNNPYRNEKFLNEKEDRSNELNVIQLSKELANSTTGMDCISHAPLDEKKHSIEIQEKETSTNSDQNKVEAKPWKIASSKWHEGIELLPLDTPIADMPEGQVFKNLEEKGKLKKVNSSSMNSGSNMELSELNSPISGKLSVTVKIPPSALQDKSSPSFHNEGYGRYNSSPQSGFSVESPASVNGYSPRDPERCSPRRGRSPAPGYTSTESSPRLRSGESLLREESPNRKRTWRGGDTDEENGENFDGRGKEKSPTTSMEKSPGLKKVESSSSLQENNEITGSRYSEDPMTGTLSENSDDSKRRRRRATATDPRAVASRVRRERIGNRMRMLHSLVPNAVHGDTASMLEEAINYVRQLQEQVENLSNAGINDDEILNGGER